MDDETKNKLFEIINNISSQANNNNSTIPEPTNETSPDILSILNKIGNSNNVKQPLNETENSFDFSSILKLQKIMQAFNTNDSRKNLINEIKPFLRTSRKNKINEYIACLSVISAFS